MEEKDRYKIIYHNYVNPVDNWMSFFDNETNRDFDNDADFEAIVEILNQQDKRIKELEQENQQLKDNTKQVCEKIKEELNNIIEVGDYYDIEKDQEINLYKQSDIEDILEQIKDVC